jgi:DNA-binding winged helix-turn-helix (wHTH) protein/TolB-like protein
VFEGPSAVHPTRALGRGTSVLCRRVDRAEIMRQWLAKNVEPEHYRFGLFEFGAASGELRREGVLVRLQSQPAKVLACLIERAGQVISRDDLRRTLWGRDTFVDFDRGLNFCISQIRSALKDDPLEPVYIRTIPKHGYQFIAPIEQVSERAPDDQRIATVRRRVNTRAVVLAWAGVILSVLAIATSYRFLRWESAKHSPIVAVLRFDNETGNPDMNRFSDALTDTVVEQLASQSSGRYRVIGNALILRGRRDQRDLTAIATSLHAAYVVLGQVQSNGGQIRILAHLIRMPDQTHVWVVRKDRTLEDPLAVESELAQKIAAEFSPRVSEASLRSASLPGASH